MLAVFFLSQDQRQNPRSWPLATETPGMERPMSLVLGKPIPLPWLQCELVTSPVLLVPLVGMRVFPGKVRAPGPSFLA